MYILKYGPFEKGRCKDRLHVLKAMMSLSTCCTCINVLLEEDTLMYQENLV